MTQQTRIILAVVALVLVSTFTLRSCTTRSSRNRSESISQELAEQKTKTDNLRKAMRYLQQMTQLNRAHTTKEVQLELNTWIQTVDRSSVNYSPTGLLNDLPPELLELVGCKSPIELQFSYWDIDYLYERQMMNRLAQWIVNFPLRDALIQPALEQRKKQLDVADALKLEDACKLFDWSMRNVALQPDASSVEEMSTDPTAPLTDNGLGYSYLPWETLLFSFGDFVERGRVFTALAEQRGIDTAWISVETEDGPGKLWTIGVVSGDDMLIFEPKLAMPVLDPDSGQFATVKDAMNNERVLRRLDLAGQFDYALNYGDIKSMELLVDLPPVAASARMKMLEQSLLRDERMTVFHDIDARQATLQRVVPDAKVRLWQVPLMAQAQAASVRERLQTLSDFTLAYMGLHGVWMLDNPVANGRLNHLYGKFENTLDEQGALSMYMACHIDNDSLQKLEYDPAIQKELGAYRLDNEDAEQHQRRIQQMQMIFRKAKVDAAFLMAQLHFDRGNYAAAESWFRDRVIDSGNPLAAPWEPMSHVCLARIYQEQGNLEKATEHLTHQPNPQEAGNRLRLRYLRRMLEVN